MLARHPRRVKVVLRCSSECLAATCRIPRTAWGASGSSACEIRRGCRLASNERSVAALSPSSCEWQPSGEQSQPAYGRFGSRGGGLLLRRRGPNLTKLSSRLTTPAPAVRAELWPARSDRRPQGQTPHGRRSTATERDGLDAPARIAWNPVRPPSHRARVRSARRSACECHRSTVRR